MKDNTGIMNKFVEGDSYVEKNYYRQSRNEL